MPYSPKQKRDTREKILESARRLFNRKGYAGVSIEEIMNDAGLTHGGFYRGNARAIEVAPGRGRRAQVACRSSHAGLRSDLNAARISSTNSCGCS